MKKYFVFAMVVGSMVAASCVNTKGDQNANEGQNVTYEFESFDGQKVTIDDTNICYQKSVENVLESQVVPMNAEKIAPGRDFIYLEDENYYFVEDASRSLLTIARKDASSETLLLGQSFLLGYNGKSFTKNVDNGSVVLSYTREGVQAAGSNYAQFTLADAPSCKEYLEQKVSENGGAQEKISEASLSGVKGQVYTYLSSSESTEGELKTVVALYAFPCGEKTVAIEVFRTMSPDDGTEMSIDADFERMFQSFLVL